MKTLERVKGIEPSYSAWKSPDFRNVFKSRSDISQLSDPLRSLQNFSLSEWRLPALRGTKEMQERRSSRTTHPDRRDVLPDLVAMRNCKSLKPSEPFFRSVNPLSLIVGIDRRHRNCDERADAQSGCAFLASSHRNRSTATGRSA